MFYFVSNFSLSLTKVRVWLRNLTFSLSHLLTFSLSHLYLIPLSLRALVYLAAFLRCSG